jgi:Zn ribbon nucleic-acid-binding protein
MTQTAQVMLVECEECGFIEMSLHEENVMDSSEEHRGHYPTHTMHLHVFESDLSRKL